MSQQSHPYRTNRDLFSNHYLTEHLRQTEPWQEVGEAEVREAYDEINELWEDKQDRVEDYNEAQLERNFIRPVFDILGIPFEIEETVMRNARRPDYGFFPSADAADAAFDREDFYEEAIAVADAKRWGRKLDTRGEEKRDFENPSYQIHAYLQETPPQWAVLTNGKQWRLYYGPTSHRLDSYYEIDLPELFEVVEGEGGIEDFKDFYLFFRQQAFLPDRSGDCFLDDVYDESSVFAEAIGEDLQNNIYEAIRVLAEGFLDTNDDLDEDDLSLIHDSSLIYLYRLIFVLYAESEGRDLLPTGNDIYSDSYSLNELKQTVADNRDETQQHYQTFQTHLWDRLEELFVLIDQGSQGKNIPKDQLYIPAYNGGLFRTTPDPDDSAEAQFLASHEADDAHLAEVIDLLTRRDADEGDGQVFVDYSSLDERHLGSIYEGLLEYKLDVADEPLTVDDGEYSPAGDGDDIEVAEGDVYLRTDAGERKATGSYYTPEYVVEYIVDETLGPLVDGIREDLVGTESYKQGGFAGEFADRVFDLKVLDPAMGSGHFLVNAVDYLAREIIDAQERQDQQAVKRGDDDAISDPRTEEGELRDINWARRKVAQRCIYGVDLNPLATELAKVSLWLRTLAAEQPLAFLDHHLKTGNSLVGSNIEEIEELESESGGTDGNTTLAEFGIARKGTIEQLMHIYQEFVSIENQDLADVKLMEAKYDEFEQNKLRQRLESMTNVHTAERFGLDNLPSDAYERMAAALEDDEKWKNIEQMQWFGDAQEWAKDHNYFHWKLEYPEVFYTSEGDDAKIAGFDAIIGNPPYVRIQNLKKTDKSLAEYLDTYYDTTHQNYDLAVPFTEAGYELLREDGLFGFIETKKWIQGEYGENLREYLAKNRAVYELIDFGDQQVFPGASTYTVLLFLQKTENESFRYAEILDLDGTVDQLREVRSSDQVIRDDLYSYTESIDRLDSSPWVFALPGERKILDYLDDFPVLEDFTDTIFVGLQTSADPVYILDVIDETGDTIEAYSKEIGEEIEIEKEITKPLLRGQDMQKWTITQYDSRVIFPYNTDSEKGEYSLITKQEMESKYPKTWKYLSQNRDRLIDRSGVDETTWWQYGRPQNLDKFESPKLLTQVLAKEASLALDRKGLITFVGGGTAGGYGITVDKDKLSYPALLALLNSSLLDWTLKKETSRFRGGYYSYAKRYLEILPICGKKLSEPIEMASDHQLLNESDSLEQGLISLTEDIISTIENKREINTSLPDYLGNYQWGDSLGDLASFQPATGVNDTILVDTAEKRENLRIGDCEIVDHGSKISLNVTARYKPEDKEGYETDRWGYTETDFIPALEFVGADDKVEELVLEFVPYAVEQGNGFASFRETATKTNSLIDRLEKLTLPEIEDISKGLDQFLQAKSKHNKLEERQMESEEIIDDMVYTAYGIDDDQRSIIEESLKNS
ncbi:Eco57I restriction-modification methylase domain-containing protein [Haloarchaeobius amylolyticus]|uniref:Eco57I restriction-modification methylase domain-containing protein n=1 Tax=Haloarchaeobius amylolyticus TaxID=1198296 RepID=UPI00226D81EF|nr:Eco57I restriction-modification methylase domain-containing protein [Haloarchaeobius amylolyticus]